MAASDTPTTPRLSVTFVQYDATPYFLLQNLEPVAVDISSYEIEDLEYKVPGGTILQPGQQLAVFSNDAINVAPLFRCCVLGWIFTEDLDDLRDGFTVKNRRGTVVAEWTNLPPRQVTEITGAPNRSGIISLTSTASAGGGFVQVVDCDAKPGKTANVNNDGPRQDRAGAAIVPFDGDGKACIYNSTSTHVVVDLQGYLAASAVDDIADVRLVDTRDLGPRRPAGSQTKIKGRPGSSAVVSIVAVDTHGAGFLQAIECGAVPGAVSNNNYDGAGQEAFQPRRRSLRRCRRGLHPHVDADAHRGRSAGLPHHRLRRRRCRRPAARHGFGPRPAGGSLTKVTGRPNSNGIGGLTATATAGAGFVQVVPCNVTPGNNANVTFDRPAQDMFSLVVLPFDANGEVCLFTPTATHLVVDIQAYFTPGSFEDVADVRLVDTRDD